MSIIALLNSLEISEDGYKCRTSNRAPWFPIVDFEIEKTLGKEKFFKLLSKYDIPVSQIGTLNFNFKSRAYKQHQAYIEKVKRQEASPGTQLSEASAKFLEENKLYEDINSKQDNKYFFVVTEKDEIFNGSGDGYLRHCLDKGLKEEVIQAKLRAIPTTRIFNPQLPFGIQHDSPETIKPFNLHKKFNWDSVQSAPQDDFQCFVDLFNHLIPNEYQRRYVYSWLTFAEDKRNNVGLVFFGEKGSGKSTAIETMKHIIGYSATYTARQQAIGAKFNAELVNCQLVVFEEAEVVGTKVKSALKAMMNGMTSIEAKGENVRKNVRSFANFIFTTNNESSIQLEYDDRRFTAPDLREDKLSQSIATPCNDILDAILDGKDYLKNMGIIKGFRDYVHSQVLEEYNPHLPYTDTQQFWTIVDASLSMVNSWILKYVREAPTSGITYEKLRAEWEKKGIKAKFPTNAYVRKFCKNYLPFNKKVLEFDGTTVTYIGEKKGLLDI